MGKKYYIIARNYEDKVWQYEKQVNTLFFARIFFTYACLRWNIVDMHVFGVILLRCIKCNPMKIRIDEKNDMDIVTFAEEYLGIKLLQYQKEYLKWLSKLSLLGK